MFIRRVSVKGISRIYQSKFQDYVNSKARDLYMSVNARFCKCLYDL